MSVWVLDTLKKRVGGSAVQLFWLVLGELWGRVGHASCCCSWTASLLGTDVFHFSQALPEPSMCPRLSDPSSHIPITIWTKKSTSQLLGPDCNSVDSLGCSCWGISTNVPIISHSSSPTPSFQQLQSYLGFLFLYSLFLFLSSFVHDFLICLVTISTIFRDFFCGREQLSLCSTHSTDEEGIC